MRDDLFQRQDRRIREEGFHPAVIIPDRPSPKAPQNREIIHWCPPCQCPSQAPTAVFPRAALIQDIKSAWSRRFPTESLADELLRRFRVNYLEALAEDMLRGVLAAIA